MNLFENLQAMEEASKKTNDTKVNEKAFTKWHTDVIANVKDALKSAKDSSNKKAPTISWNGDQIKNAKNGKCDSYIEIEDLGEDFKSELKRITPIVKRVLTQAKAKNIKFKDNKKSFVKITFTIDTTLFEGLNLYKENSMMDEANKLESEIRDALGDEGFLDAIIAAMSVDDKLDIYKYIYRMYDIGYLEDEELDESKKAIKKESENRKPIAYMPTAGGHSLNIYAVEYGIEDEVEVGYNADETEMCTVDYYTDDKTTFEFNGDIYDLDEFMRVTDESTSGIGAGAYTTKAIDILPEVGYSRAIKESTDALRLATMVNKIRKDNKLSESYKNCLEESIKIKLKDSHLKAKNKNKK